MIAADRDAFNASFTEERYRAFVDSLTNQCGVPIEFRLSETPCFFPAALIDDLAGAARDMVGQLLDDRDYRRAAEDIVPSQFRMPNGETLPTFVQVDFGLVRVGDRIEGRLVELQAFPSLYGFQMMLAETARGRLGARGPRRCFPGGLDRGRLSADRGRGDRRRSRSGRSRVDGDRSAKQKTLPDFAITETVVGRAGDRRARPFMREGRRFSTIATAAARGFAASTTASFPTTWRATGIPMPFDYRDELDVEWTGGPDWFFRISKFSMPLLRHPWVPKTMFLSDPAGSEDPASFRPGNPDWLLKPLFSYAGGGIVFAPTDADIAAIPEGQRHLYVLQERVAFTPVIAHAVRRDTGGDPVDVRREGDGIDFVLPLVRMGRGRMMGVDHNKGLRWVGAARP